MKDEALTDTKGWKAMGPKVSSDIYIVWFLGKHTACPSPTRAVQNAHSDSVPSTFRSQFPPHFSNPSPRASLLACGLSPGRQFGPASAPGQPPRGKAPGAGAEKASGPRTPRNTQEEGRGARAGCSPRDAGAAAPPRTRTAATPAAREPRPCLQAVGSDQPPCRVSRKERTVETDTRSRSRRQTRRPRLSLRGKTTGWGSRGGGHTNWSRHLLLPGACGVYTPRRRSEPARTERERLGRRGREEGGRRRSRVKNGLSRPYAEAGSYGRYSGVLRPQSLEDTTE